MFRKKTLEAKRQLKPLQSSLREDEEDGLVGLDAKIPGGRYDSTVDEALKGIPPIKTLTSHLWNH